MDDYEQLLHSLVVERFSLSSGPEPDSANVPPRSGTTNPQPPAHVVQTSPLGCSMT